MTTIFKEVGEKISRDTNYPFWGQDNQHMIIYNPRNLQPKN